jgi:hypothetical protein
MPFRRPTASTVADPDVGTAKQRYRKVVNLSRNALVKLRSGKMGWEPGAQSHRIRGDAFTDWLVWPPQHASATK